LEIASTRLPEQGQRQVVAHVGDEQKLGAGNRRGGVLAGLDRRERVVLAMNHERRPAHLRQFSLTLPKEALSGIFVNRAFPDGPVLEPKPDLNVGATFC
jgi:hypothetical protein